MKNAVLINQLKVSLGVILFSFIPILVRHGKGISFFQLSFARVFITTVILLLLIIITNRNLLNRSKNKAQLFLFGIFHALTMLTSFYAIKKLSIAAATVFLFAGNIYLFILSIAFFKEKADKKSLLSLTLALVGFALVFAKEHIITQKSIIDYIIAFFSGVFMTAVFALGKRLRCSYDEKTLTFYQNMLASIILLPSVIFLPLNLNLNSSLIYIALGVFCTAIPFLLIYEGLKHLETKRISILLTLNIPLPIMLAIVFFKEMPSPIAGIGIALMTLSTILLYSKNNS